MIARGLNFLLSGWSGRGLLAVLLAFAIAIPWLVGDQSYVTYLVFTFFVFAVFGHAWNLLAGYCGLLSFGNQVYVGIGGFTLAIIFYYGGINVWLALPISGIVTAAFAFLLATPVRESLVGIGVWKPVAVAGVLWAGYEVALGYFPEADIFGEVYIRRVIILLLIFLGALPLLRLQGAYFAVASWLIAAAVGSIFNEWKVVGAGGGMQIKTDATQIEMYYAGLGLLVFATVVIARLLKSRYGLALTAVRDDEEAARTAGIDIRKVKLIVFVVAGGLSGLAAGLFYIDAVIITPPAAFTIFWSAYFVFIVVAGGMGTLAGPIVGAAIFVVVDRVLSGVTEYPLLVLGIAAVVIIFVMPRGAMGIVNALRHLDDSATGRNELLEALGIGDRLQRSLFFARRRDTKPGVVAALLVPGSPLPLLARDNPPWTEIAGAFEEASAALHEAKPDVILIYSTQWLAVLDQPWQTRPRVRGLHVDENWYEYGEIDYDFEIDTELAEACIGGCRSLGIKARGVNYDGFPIDTGSIVANRFLNPGGDCAVVMAANNLYHDWEQTLKLGEMAANQAVRLGRRVAVVGVGGLSGSAFRHEIDPADDHIASESEDAWNRRMLDMMVKGDASAMKALIADYAREARADMGFKHFAWVLGAVGGRFHSATVHAYGPIYGSGAAVVEFHVGEEQAALAATRQRRRRRQTQREQAAQARSRNDVGAGRRPLLRWLRADSRHRTPSDRPPASPAATLAAPAPLPARRQSSTPRSAPALYRSFRTQAEIDAQYDVESSVPDFGRHVDFFLSNSARVRTALEPRLDVPFGPTTAETLDIYPAARADAPIHMFIHGGYWHSLSSKEFSFVAEGLVKAGVTVVINNYALCPDVTITEIVRQNRAAVAWLYRNAATFGGNRSRIHVSGHSAGGHLTAMLLATDWKRNFGLPPDLVKGGTAISGLFDLEPFVHSWLQPKLRLTPDEIDRTSPIRHIPDRASPLIVTFGGDESAEFRRQSESFLAAWTAKGLDGRYLDLPGRNHFTVLEDYMDPDSPLCRSILRQVGIA